MCDWVKKEGDIYQVTQFYLQKLTVVQWHEVEAGIQFLAASNDLFGFFDILKKVTI